MNHTTLYMQSHRKLKWKLRCRELDQSTWVGICQTNCDGPESYPREVAPYTWLPHATETGVSYEQQLCLSILRLKYFLVLFHCRKESSWQSHYWFGQWRSLVHPRDAWLCLWFPWNLQSDVAITKISCSSVSFICSKILHLRWANPAYSSVRTFTP